MNTPRQPGDPFHDLPAPTHSMGCCADGTDECNCSIGLWSFAPPDPEDVKPAETLRQGEAERGYYVVAYKDGRPVFLTRSSNFTTFGRDGVLFGTEDEARRAANVSWHKGYSRQDEELFLCPGERVCFSVFRGAKKILR